MRSAEGGSALSEQHVRIVIATVFALFALTFGGCGPTERLAIEGELDTAFVTKLQAASRRGAPVTLSSYGGNPKTAFAAVPLIDSYPGSVAIGRLCLSSCAEFVLPTKAHKTLLEKPLIGFHGSDQIARWLASRTGQTDPICGQVRADSQRNRFRSNGWNPDFWKEVASRLMIFSFRNKSSPGKCASMVIKSEVSIWFPTSIQMKGLLGFDPSGPLCSDEELCWRSRVHDAIIPMEVFMVGDDIYYMTEQETIELGDRDSFKGPYLAP